MFTGHTDFLTLTTLDDLTDCPVSIIVVPSNDSRQLITDGRALIDQNGLMDLSIPVIEGYGPDLDKLRVGIDRCDFRSLILRSDLRITGIPAFETIAGFRGRIRRHIALADGFIQLDIDRLYEPCIFAASDVEVNLIEVPYGPGGLAALGAVLLDVAHDIDGEAVDFAADAAILGAEGNKFRIAGVIFREMPDTGILAILIIIIKSQGDRLLGRSGLPGLAIPIPDGEIQHQSVRQLSPLMCLDRLNIAIRLFDRVSNQLSTLRHFAGHYNRNASRNAIGSKPDRLLRIKLDRLCIMIDDISFVLLCRFGLSLSRRRGRDAFLRDRTLHHVPVPGGQHRRGEQAQHEYEREQDREYTFLHCVFPPDANVIQYQTVR